MEPTKIEDLLNDMKFNEGVKPPRKLSQKKLTEAGNKAMRAWLILTGQKKIKTKHEPSGM